MDVSKWKQVTLILPSFELPYVVAVYVWVWWQTMANLTASRIFAGRVVHVSSLCAAVE